MLVLALAALLPLVQEQEQVPTFRTGVTSVLVDTLALDADGNPVPDLTADDFEIYEDGVRQTIATFDVTDWQSYVAATTSEEALPPTGASVNTYPRRFIFVLNRQGARFDWLHRAKRGLRAFVVDSMAEGDEAMVIDIGYSMKIEQEFRANKEDTLEAIRNLSQMTIDYPMGADRAAGQLYRDFDALGQELARIPGRKIIVLLSNELMTFTGPGSRRSNEAYTLQRAVESLNQANTSVYTIDLRGPESTSTLAGGLSPLATETGGRFFRNSVSFERPLRRIGKENQRYYLLSYVPTNAERDGTYRRIDVRVSRPDIEVIARKGYFAREPSTSVTDATESVASDKPAEEAPTPSFVLPAAVEMTSYFLPSGTGSARVPISVALPHELLADTPRQLTVTISQNGEVLQTFDNEVDSSRYYAVENVELQPGPYLMEITLREEGRELYQASSEIHVPSGFGERFGLSSIVPVVAPDATGGLGSDIPILPTTTLPRGDDAFLLFQVFAGRERPSERAYLSYTVFDDDGDEVGSGGKNGPMDLSPEHPGGTPVILRIPMQTLRAGTYRIDIRVEDRYRGRRASSEIELRIN